MAKKKKLYRLELLHRPTNRRFRITSFMSICSAMDEAVSKGGLPFPGDRIPREEWAFIEKNYERSAFWFTEKGWQSRGIKYFEESVDWGEYEEYDSFRREEWEVIVRKRKAPEDQDRILYKDKLQMCVLNDPGEGPSARTLYETDFE